MIKQRNESCEVYKKAGRSELLENETKEMDVIRAFLPQQLSDEEVKRVCEETVKSIGASSMKDMGKVMKMMQGGGLKNMMKAMGKGGMQNPPLGR